MNKEEQIAFDAYMEKVELELQKFNEKVETLTRKSAEELAQHIQLDGTYKSYNDYVISLLRNNKNKHDDFEIPLSEQEWMKTKN